MVRKTSWLIGLVVVLVALAVGAGAADAPPAGILSLKINPPIVQLVAQPGETVSHKIIIQNTGVQTETIELGLMKFSARGEAGEPQLEDPAPEDAFMDWLTVPEKQLILAVNEMRTVAVTIAPPASAVGGYYYAVVFRRANVTAPDQDPGAEVGLTGGVATLILLTVDVPDTQRSLELVEFSTSRRIYEYLPVEFRVRVKNTGAVHLVPDGSIFIDSKGSDTATIELNKGGGNVLPNSHRLFEAAWSDGFPVAAVKMEGDKVVTDKNGRAVKILQWDLNQVPKFRLGRYVAKLVFVYNDGTRDIPLRGEAAFWVIPWKLLLILLAVLILVFLGLRAALAPLLGFGRRRTKRR